MTPEVTKVLQQEQTTKQVDELLSKCKELLRISRGTMKNYYSQWDRNDRVYRGERAMDNADRQAINRNEPPKVVVPLTYSQTQTFTAFMTMLFTQRDYVYELGGTGVEDEQPAKLGQACLERDLNYNSFKGVKLPQFCTDIGRFGLGIIKSDWTRETVPTPVQVPDPNFVQPVGMQPVQPPMITQYQPKTTYLGNRIKVISPYNWFPDTRLPISRFREGEFCADECEQSIGELQKLEAEGVCAGIKFVPRARQDMVEDRRLTIMTRDYIAQQPEGMSRYVVLTEVQLRLNPSKVMISDNTPLNKDVDTEVPYIIWIANDSRIVRIDEMGYDHNEFTYDASQFFNDQCRVVNFSLADLVGPMQDILDWLMNARVTNVRKVIQNQLVVDPRYVEMNDLKDRLPVIRLKSTAQGLGINSYIQQLNVTDVTTGHLTDMSVVQGFAKDASGISENLLGQYASGRRSARESQSVNMNAAARLQVVAQGIWDQALLPLGRKMLCNLRQGLDEQQLVNIIGVAKFIKNAQTGVVQQFLPVDKSQLIGNYDFLIFDATLPSQRMANAAALQELLVALSKDPRLVLVFNKDPKLILDEILELRNIRNAERFDLTPERAGQLVALAGGPGNQAPAGGPQRAGTNGPGNGQPAGGQPR